jgi:hypothetical protein
MAAKSSEFENFDRTSQINADLDTEKRAKAEMQGAEG